MSRILCLLQLIMTVVTYPVYNPFGHLYSLPYAYPANSGVNYGYNYASLLPTYNSYVPTGIPTHIDEYHQDQAVTIESEFQPSLNVLAKLPYAMSNEFSVVPLMLVSKNDLNMVSQGDIVSVSDEKPLITISLGSNNSISCTPAVRITLEKPIIVETQKSNILFPSEVQITHQDLTIPIKIGAVIAPVVPNTYVSRETPIAIKVIYAVPTKPLKITITINQDQDYPPQQLQTKPENQEKEMSSPVIDQRFPEVSPVDTQSNEAKKPPSVETETKKPCGCKNSSNASELPTDNGFGALSNNSDYVNNEDAVILPNQEAVIVESESELPPKNVTVIDFPEKEAEPSIQVDEEDEELVNRNPPLFLAPAGIVQSTQPESHIEPFHNDKESMYLETLREQSKLKKI